MRRRRYLALVATFLAGCSGGGSESTPTPTATPTATPSPTESPTATASPTPSPTPELSLSDVSFPDGASEDSVTSDLVTTHQQLLFGEPYTLELQRTIEGFETSITKTTLEIGSNSAHQAQTATGVGTKSFWKDGSVGFAQANGGQFYYTISPQIDRAKLGDFEYIRAHIASGNFTPVEALRQGDQAVIKAEASTATASEYLKNRGVPDQGRVKSIDEYSGTLMFTPNGQITKVSLDWSYTSKFEDQTVAEQYEYTVSDVGQTEVTPPDWLSTAKEDAVSFTASVSEDGKYAVVEIEGESELPDNWAISMSSESAGHGSTRGTITADGGDTVYIGIKDGDAVVGVNEKPSGVEDLGGRVFLLLDINGIEVIDRDI